MNGLIEYMTTAEHINRLNKALTIKDFPILYEEMIKLIERVLNLSEGFQESAIMS
jgi:hypothetical protein